MQSESQSFIGYGRLEDLLAAHTDPTQPLYVELLSRFLTGNPIGRAIQTLDVQDFDGEGRVRYCRIPVGAYDLIHGSPFDEGRAKASQERATAAYESLIQHLATQRYRIERATIAMPKDLILLDGTADFLRVLTK